MSGRRKVSTALDLFESELRRLTRLDNTNQDRFFGGPGRPGKDRLSASQMHLLTESIFSRAFNRYEDYMEQVFLLYCQGRKTLSGKNVGSYLRPRNSKHAKLLVKSGMPFLEWNTPDKIVDRCEIYLLPDNPIYLAVTTHAARLSNMRRVRNAIAHSSDEADQQFRKTVRSELGVSPLKNPSVGEFLIMNDRTAPQGQYYLRTYISTLRSVATIAAT